MEHLPEFIANNLFLCAAFVIVLVLAIKAEFSHHTNKANQLTPMLATRFMNNEAAVVIDVRETADFDNGHIKNAINIPLAELQDKLPGLQQYRDGPVLTYCKDGKQSNRACKLLKQAGFNNVRNISGGMHNWQEANLPVIK